MRVVVHILQQYLKCKVYSNSFWDLSWIEKCTTWLNFKVRYVVGVITSFVRTQPTTTPDNDCAVGGSEIQKNIHRGSCGATTHTTPTSIQYFSQFHMGKQTTLN